MKNAIKDTILFSGKDTRISLALMLAACVLCAPLQAIGGSDFHVPLIFVLAVMLISRLTNGYFYGIVSSFLSVFCVNFVFTYPYFAFNFTISGYPLTFISMLTVSIITCALTTQIKKQEKMRAEVEKEKMRANLLRAISHDLRTPLTSIIGSVTAVSENMDSLSREKQSALLEDAKEDAQWLIRMVENLLSITRIGERAADIKKENEAVEEIIGEAVGKFKKQYPDIRVIISVPRELLLVPMDAMLIEQLILNLLYNCARHGRYTTDIRLTVVRGGNSALFTIEDNGAGFPEDTLPFLFESRGTPARGKGSADDRRDMGIGLSSCMSIVNAHGGSMTAGNGDGGGASVEFTLPLEEVRTCPP